MFAHNAGDEPHCGAKIHFHARVEFGCAAIVVEQHVHAEESLVIRSIDVVDSLGDGWDNVVQWRVFRGDDVVKMLFGAYDAAIVLAVKVAFKYGIAQQLGFAILALEFQRKIQNAVESHFAQQRFLALERTFAPSLKFDSARLNSMVNPLAASRPRHFDITSGVFCGKVEHLVEIVILYWHR